MTQDTVQQAQTHLHEAIEFIAGDIAAHGPPSASADVRELTTLAEQLRTLIEAGAALERWQNGVHVP